MILRWLLRGLLRMRNPSHPFIKAQLNLSHPFKNSIPLKILTQIHFPLSFLSPPFNFPIPQNPPPSSFQPRFQQFPPPHLLRPAQALARVPVPRLAARRRLRLVVPRSRRDRRAAIYVVQPLRLAMPSPSEIHPHAIAVRTVVVQPPPLPALLAGDPTSPPAPAQHPLVALVRPRPATPPPAVSTSSSSPVRPPASGNFMHQ